MFMIAATVVEIEDPVGSLLAMFRFLCMVLAAEATHFFITMPLLLWAVTRTNPYKYMFGCLKAFGMAFASNNRQDGSRQQRKLCGIFEFWWCR